jgi:hypothetical protein
MPEIPISVDDAVPERSSDTQIVLAEQLRQARAETFLKKGAA